MQSIDLTRLLAQMERQTEAHRAVQAAVRQGVLPAPNASQCIDCGADARAHHHHKGYAPEHRLTVVPLCDSCHGRRHHMSPALRTAVETGRIPAGVSLRSAAVLDYLAPEEYPPARWFRCQVCWANDFFLPASRYFVRTSADPGWLRPVFPVCGFCETRLQEGRERGWARAGADDGR